MADPLFDLEQNLGSRKEQLTSQEANILQRWKSQALNQFTAGVIAGGALVWAATWKLHRLLRINLSGGAAILLGFRRFSSSLDSSVDHVLALDGTRIQRELANIIVKKYRHDPGKMQLISKHFYLEEVFDDSTSEPKLRWRYRNFFTDNINQDQGTHDDSQNVSLNAIPSDIHNNVDRKRTGSTDNINQDQGTHDDSQNVSLNAIPSDIHNNVDRKRTDSRSGQIHVNSGTDLMADPLDCVFGYTATSEEIHHSTPSSMPSRAQSRAHKRAHRRRQLRHQEGSLGSHDSKHSKFDVM
ncbi:hypothetical protein CRYUN_Cryun36dG0043600 [Craigia yunnanensis]